jgi:hypothetical protein
MIDFDHFWMEAGCMPGLSKGETEAQLRQLKAHYGNIEGLLAGIQNRPGMEPRPGVTAQQIEDWERERGVRLPDVLRQAMARQNGGYVYRSHIRILPLAQIANPEEDFWEWASYEEEDVADRDLVFQFAEDEDLGGSFFLDYNLKGPQQEPGVLEYHSDPGDLDRRAKSVTKFFARMLETFEGPLVNWSETESLEEIARETIDLSEFYKAPAKEEQVLGRQAGVLVLFTREQALSGQHLTKTTLPEPLDRRMAMIRPFRPAPVGTYGLILQPEKSEGIVELDSQQTPEGQWKNHTSHGVPVCVQFESHERSRLEELRRTLLGQPAAGRAQALDEHLEKSQQQMEKLQQHMAGLTPEQQRAAALQIAPQMWENLKGLLSFASPDAETMPPEAARLQEMLQEKMKELRKRVQETMAKHPLDPESQRVVEEMMKRLQRPGDDAGT